MPRKCHSSPPWPAAPVSRLLADPLHCYLPAEADWRPEWISAVRPSPPAGDPPHPRSHTSPRRAGPDQPGKQQGILYKHNCNLSNLLKLYTIILPAGVMYWAGSTPATPGGIPGTSLFPWVVFTLILLELVAELRPRLLLLAETVSVLA